MVTITLALAESTDLLKKNNIDTPRLDAEIILSFVLHLSRLKVMTEGDKTLETEEYQRYKTLIEDRAKGMPTAYILGRKEFMGLNFIVRPGVLIPRGDTELAVEMVIERCRGFDKLVYIADIGCGSGAIGISVAKYAANAFVTMVDISDAAIGTTEENIRLNNVKDRVKAVKGNLLQPILGQKFDIIVSNPPYIETDEIKSLMKDVREYEPLLALDGGDEGLDFYNAITNDAASYLRPSGMLVYEIGWNQAEAVRDILNLNGFQDIMVMKDLAGLNRCITGIKK